MDHTTPEQRQKVISGLRTLADFLENRPDVPAPRNVEATVFSNEDTDDEQRSEIATVAQLIGSEIDAHGTEYGHYRTRIRFGPVTYSAVAVLSRARARWTVAASYYGSVFPNSAEEA